MGLIDTGTNIGAAKQASEKPADPGTKTGKGTPFVRMSRGKGEIYGDYNVIDDMESRSSKEAKLEMWIAKTIGEKLISAYPRREWGVQVDIGGGVVIITCPSLSKEKGYFLHIKGETLFDLAERAVKAGGEILERYNLSRERNFDPDIIEDLARNVRDDVISSDA